MTAPMLTPARWEAWADWITPHSGAERPAPQSPGSPAFEPMTEAPGDYVRRAPGL